MVCFLFIVPSIRNFITPTDELIFFRGSGLPPTRSSINRWLVLIGNFHHQPICFNTNQYQSSILNKCSSMLWHLQDSDLPVNAPLTQRRILIGWVTVTGTNGVFLWIPCFLLGYKLGFGGIFDGINLLYTVINQLDMICVFSPHLCVGFLFLVLHFRLPAPAPACRPHTTYSHTQLVNTQLAHSHNLSPHNLLTRNLLTHNLSTHNLLTHTHNLLTHNLLTHTTCHHTTWSHTTYSHTTCRHTTCSHTQLTHRQLAHTQLAHTQVAHTQLTHTQLVNTQLAHTHNLSPHNLLTHNFSTHNLSPHNLLTHNFLTHNLSTHTHTHTLRGRRDTWRHGRALCVAGVVLMALGWLWWRAWFPVDAVVAAAVCVAGVALGDIDLHFAWHLATSTWRHRPSHTTLSHNPFTHTTLSHTILSHTHNFVTHTQRCHIQLFHTQHLTHNIVTYNSFTHNTFTYTNLHTHTRNNVTQSSFNQPVLLHLLSFLPFPSHFHICLMIMGRSWHVVFSGPLIFGVCVCLKWRIWCKGQKH